MFEDDYTCTNCSNAYCDGTKRCDMCGTDTACTEQFCPSCQYQKEIDEYPYEPLDRVIFPETTGANVNKYPKMGYPVLGYFNPFILISKKLIKTKSAKLSCNM